MRAALGSVVQEAPVCHGEWPPLRLACAALLLEGATVNQIAYATDAKRVDVRRELSALLRELGAVNLVHLAAKLARIAHADEQPPPAEGTAWSH